MRVEVDWEGDGSRVGAFDVERGAMVLPDGSAAGTWYVPITITCAVCGHVETLHYSPHFVEQQANWAECAAVDGSCDEPCEGVARGRR